MYVVLEPDMRRMEVSTWPDGEIAWQELGPAGTPVTAHGVWEVDGLYGELDRLATS